MAFMRSALSRAGAAVLIATAAAPALAQQVVASDSKGTQVTEIDLQAEAERIPESSRKTVLGRAQNVAGAANNLYTRRRLAMEAERDGIDKNPTVAAALRIARERVLSDLRIAEIDKAAEPDAKALEAYARSQYNADPKRFTGPETVQVRHILIAKDAPDAKATAEALRATLVAGEDFAALAKEKSADPGSAVKGGELGFIQPGQMVPAFEQAAFALKSPGDFSPVVETQFGYHVIQLEKRRPAGVHPFEDVKAGLMAEARVKILESARSNKSSDLLKDAKLNEKAIESFSARYR